MLKIEAAIWVAKSYNNIFDFFKLTRIVLNITIYKPSYFFYKNGDIS